MTHPKLEQLYNKFWMNFTDALPKSVSYNPPSGNAFTINKITDTEFSIELKVDFKRLRYKSSNKRSNLALQVRGNKKCSYADGNEPLITYSNVKVYYFEYEERKDPFILSLIESLHYDYETRENELKNHPVYHCQFGSYKKESFFGRNDYVLGNPNKCVHHHQIRIPTANMDMISVLLSITADHLSPQDFKKILDVYDNGDWHNKFPHISHHPNGFDPKNCYRSRAWYIDP